ncbi:FGGY-family carbohydrate kinase [Methylobacterium sp. J-026]|uniref:FGGY-family carbohydrate kinase n=1 Tax=Methylobacterium sp. J-026 TaxID=2836624 RepID=UPI001FBA0E36|nr:FGGY-family carbohydrate kinase [Methylobacterium sp. J-026]MCJ2134191.1 FGGY-family carbohydrate kinase [Methylobacterium sp. J-026]
MSAHPPRFVAVIDVGKTNAKLALHDLAAGQDIFVATTPNTVLRDGPYPHADTERLWRFLLAALAECARAHAIDAISITTHGACVALVDDDGLVLPILDYESAAPESLRADYDRLRPPFSQTCSPRLPNGLNVGAQLYWQEQTFPQAFARARRILFYPQYWAWRLTGVAACEVTSLGCHTDLWRPVEGGVSALATQRGWDRLLAPMRSAFDVLGPLKPAWADAIGMSGRKIPVHCGIHDSNASLLPYLRATPAPVTVLSTGTWIIALAVGGATRRLDPRRDTLANVDAFARAVPSARFMGGREFDALTITGTVSPTPADIAAVLDGAVMALPSFAPGTGPYPDAAGTWTHDPAQLTLGQRTAAASLYCALMTARMLEILDAGGGTIVEGPFARNRVFLDALATLTGRPVTASTGFAGTTTGCAQLATRPGDFGRMSDGAVSTRAAAPDARIAAYARRWQERAATGA